MGIKQRISGIFKGKDTDSEQGASATDNLLQAEPATAEEREHMLGELNRGFQHVSHVLGHLDQSLQDAQQSFQALTASQQELPPLLKQQQHLMQGISQHLQQRDQAQAAMVDQLQRIGEHVERQEHRHDQQVQFMLDVPSRQPTPTRYPATPRCRTRDLRSFSSYYIIINPTRLACIITGTGIAQTNHCDEHNFER